MGKRDRPPAAPPFHNPFAKLAGKVGDLPPGPSPDVAPGRPTPRTGPARAVVRMERSGRGGRTVTVVDLQVAGRVYDNSAYSARGDLHGFAWQFQPGKRASAADPAPQGP